MSSRARDQDAQRHATHLDHTLRELQRRIADHENDLVRLRATQNEVPLSTAAQTEIITLALQESATEEPFLPFPGSVLPALLALRKTHQTIQESKAYLAKQIPRVEKDKRRLEQERANLKDQELLAEALEARIQAVREELASPADTAPDAGAKGRMDELREKKKGYDRGTSSLMKTLITFIQEQLAPMLAAEDLGGPVVGDLMDIDTDDLAGGFNAQGKLNKVKNGAKPDSRQRRLDEIWGGAAAEDNDEDGNAAQRAEEDEVAAAAAEMRSLTEDLLNQLAEAKGDNSASYVKLARESAAARFLVRSKVAQFHPKDATRLRLIDFGRDLDD